MDRKTKRNNNEYLLLVFAGLIIVLSVGSLVAVIASEYRHNEDENTKIELTYTPQAETPTIEPTPAINATPTLVPTATPVPEIPIKIQEFREKNEDTIGYINIEGTAIDYPVMYSGDNEYYLHYDFDKNYSYHGAVFLDFRCDVYDMPETRNIILYGHRMKDGSMFRSLVFYFEKDFFDEHKIVHFDTLAGEMEWEVFATFETHIDFDYIHTEFENDEQWLEFIEYCQSLSLYETDVELSENDIVLTLSTCSVSHDYRVVVMAKLLQ
ncbi:MAG: class B sortase [Eubacteriales bacterium]